MIVLPTTVEPPPLLSSSDGPFLEWSKDSTAPALCIVCVALRHADGRSDAVLLTVVGDGAPNSDVSNADTLNIIDRGDVNENTGFLSGSTLTF